MNQDEFKKIITRAIVAVDARSGRLNPNQIDRAKNRALILQQKVDELNLRENSESWIVLFATLLGAAGYNRELPINEIEELADRCDRINKWMEEK